MAYDFTGKRCFVTGAASGIGRATALRLGREGADLFLTDRAVDGLESVVEEIKAAGG
ncbi:SDR family NAD(P)-dependent oxidoreductase, partial [Clostridioides difficile]|nr:SDR family NAD(P)-dependent oxidoreductase [Clostridioides difficile]